MRKTFCATILAMVLVAGLPAIGVSQTSSHLYDDTFDEAGLFLDFIDFGTVPTGTYLLELEDISDPKPGFLGLGFSLFGAGFGSAELLSLSLNQVADSLTFSLDADTALYASILGMTTFEAGSGLFPTFKTGSFSVKLSSVPIPATALLFGSGLFALMVLNRRKFS